MKIVPAVFEFCVYVHTCVIDAQSEKLKKSEKWENHKNSTYSKVKLYIICIYIFFSTMDIKIFTYGGGARGRAWGRQGALSIQKNEKITRTVPILKSNSA